MQLKLNTMLLQRMSTMRRQLRRIVIMHTPLKLMQQLPLRPKYYLHIQVMRLSLYLQLVQPLKNVIYL